MNTKAKKRKSGRVARPKRPTTRSTRASRDRVVAEPDTIRDTIADGSQTTDVGGILLYRAKGGIALEVRVQGDTVWLTQPQMAKLFGRERSVVTKHVNNVFAEGELDRKSNVQNTHIASSDKSAGLTARALGATLVSCGTTPCEASSRCLSVWVGHKTQNKTTLQRLQGRCCRS